MDEMTLHQLKVFEAIGKYSNLTKAAGELRLSQPSISKHLRLLEEECGAKFHLRMGQGIKLTDEGLLFLRGVSPILRQIDDLKASIVGKTAEKKTKILTIGASQSPSASFVLEVLKAFGRTHPDVRAILRTGDSPTVAQMVLTSEVEIGLVTNRLYNPHLIAEPFRSENIVAVVSPRHPLAKKAKINAEDLAKIPVVLRTGGRIATELERVGVKLRNIVMQCDTLEVKRAAVQSGVGVGFFYRDTVELALNKGLLKAIEIPRVEEMNVECSIVYRQRAILSPNAQDFVALLRSLPLKRSQSKHGLKSDFKSKGHTFQ
jgi:DNA-binding transcriptional LysR family regulator